MPDVFTKDERSKIMSGVKSKKNKSTELKIIQIFKKYHIKGWRRNYKIFGNPDFVFPQLKLIVFTDGCFWHGHNCRNTEPVDNAVYWQNKIVKNRSRDRLVSLKLIKKGWHVLRIWECELNVKKNENVLYSKLEKHFNIKLS